MAEPYLPLRSRLTADLAAAQQRLNALAEQTRIFQETSDRAPQDSKEAADAKAALEAMDVDVKARLVRVLEAEDAISKRLAILVERESRRGARSGSRDWRRASARGREAKG
jgi:hypothetical protein